MMTIFGLRRIQAQCLMQQRTHPNTTTRRSWMDHHVLYEESATARAQCVLQTFLVDLLCRLQALPSFILYVQCIASSQLYHSCLSLPLEFRMYSQENAHPRIHDAVTTRVNLPLESAQRGTKWSRSSRVLITELEQRRQDVCHGRTKPWHGSIGI